MAFSASRWASGPDAQDFSSRILRSAACTYENYIYTSVGKRDNLIYKKVNSRVQLILWGLSQHHCSDLRVDYSLLVLEKFASVSLQHPRLYGARYVVGHCERRSLQGVFLPRRNLHPHNLIVEEHRIRLVDQINIYRIYHREDHGCYVLTERDLNSMLIKIRFVWLEDNEHTSCNMVPTILSSGRNVSGALSGRKRTSIFCPIFISKAFIISFCSWHRSTHSAY